MRPSNRDYGRYQISNPSSGATRTIDAFAPYAGEDILHEFLAFPTLGLPQCRTCYGFSDDPRHVLSHR